MKYINYQFTKARLCTHNWYYIKV